MYFPEWCEIRTFRSVLCEAAVNMRLVWYSGDGDGASKCEAVGQMLIEVIPALNRHQTFNSPYWDASLTV